MGSAVFGAMSAATGNNSVIAKKADELEAYDVSIKVCGEEFADSSLINLVIRFLKQTNPQLAIPMGISSKNMELGSPMGNRQGGGAHFEHGGDAYNFGDTLSPSQRRMLAYGGSSPGGRNGMGSRPMTTGGGMSPGGSMR